MPAEATISSRLHTLHFLVTIIYNEAMRLNGETESYLKVLPIVTPAPFYSL